jgi:hypothetical protein
VAENPGALALMFLRGINVAKLNVFRKTLQEQKLDLTFLRNISFASDTIAELLINTSAKKRFTNQTVAAVYTADTELEATHFSINNPVWLHFANPGNKLSDVVRSNFVSHALSEQKRRQNSNVPPYYFDWVRRLEWNQTSVAPSNPRIVQ